MRLESFSWCGAMCQFQKRVCRLYYMYYCSILQEHWSKPEVHILAKSSYPDFSFMNTVLQWWQWWWQWSHGCCCCWWRWSCGQLAVNWRTSVRRHPNVCMTMVMPICVRSPEHTSPFSRRLVKAARIGWVRVHTMFFCGIIKINQNLKSPLKLSTSIFASWGRIEYRILLGVKRMMSGT